MSKAASESASLKKSESLSSTDKTLYGFWVYLMTDCILFASLFATYVVLHNNTYSGPNGRDIFNMPYVLTETLILLTSSFTCGLATIAMYRRDKAKVIAWFAATFLLGASFLGMEIHEFINLVHQGNSWRRSGFLSSYFTLVGTHGLHITIGLIWMLVMMIKVWRKGLKEPDVRRLTMLSLFWHFLDLIWIFIFTIVYLMGVIGV